MKDRWLVYRSKNREKWWAVYLTTQKEKHWDRILIPTIGVTPWHKSVLASFENLGYETWTCLVEFKFWYWRLRISRGVKKYL